jgi:hypothetical protein
MKSLLQEKRGVQTALLNDSKLARYYRARRSFQASLAKRSRHRHDRRECVCCSARVSNRNLGGFSGRSALIGELYCLRCADLPRQRLLNFGRSEQ